MSRLLENYKSNIVDDLKKRLNLNNIHEVPKLTKIVINMGIGDAKDDSKLIDKAQEELSLISGQKAIKTKAKKAKKSFQFFGEHFVFFEKEIPLKNPATVRFGMLFIKSGTTKNMNQNMKTNYFQNWITI